MRSPLRILADRQQRLSDRLEAAGTFRNWVPDEGWPAIFAALWRAASDPREPVPLRAACLRYCAQKAFPVEPASLLETLRFCATSRSPQIRAASAPALAKLDHPDARTLLRQLMLEAGTVAESARASKVAALKPAVFGLPEWRRRPKARRGTHATFLQRAIDLAVENVESGRGGPFGAVIVRNNRIVAEGTNLVTAVNDPTCHAEVMAIRAACAFESTPHLSDCIIYSSCEPCPMCLGAIHWARLAQLYFAATRADAAAAGFDDSFIYDQVPVAPAHRSIPAKRLLARDGVAPLHCWAGDALKVDY